MEKDNNFKFEFVKFLLIIVILGLVALFFMIIDKNYGGIRKDLNVNNSINEKKEVIINF